MSNYEGMPPETPAKPIQRNKRELTSAEKVSPLDKKNKTSSKASSKAARKLLESPKMGERTDIVNILQAIQGIQKDVSSLPKIEQSVLAVQETIKEFQTSLEHTQSELSDACEEIVQLKARCDELDSLKGDIACLKSQNANLEKKVIDMENYSRRENLIIHGLMPSKNSFNLRGSQENCFETALSLFEMLGVGPCPMQRCHRLPRKPDSAQKQPAPLIIRFVCYQDKMNIMRNRGKLRGTSIFLKDDETLQVECKQAALRPIVRFLKQHDPSTAIVKSDSIRFRGNIYPLQKIKDIPIDISPLGLLVNETHTLFAGETCPLSNLYDCKLIADGVSFSSAEQFYQVQKCKAMGKPDIAIKILAAETAREAMVLGKQCATTKAWTASTGKEIMEKIAATKLQQVPEFQAMLKSNVGKILVEATVNPVWGSGVPIYAQDALNVDLWKGENMLGKILQCLTDSLPH